MAANGSKKTSTPLSIIAILAVLGGIYYASQSQLKSSRPKAPPGLIHAMSEKDKIDARLWQDPLKVACEHEKTMHGMEIGEHDSYVKESSHKHSLFQVTNRISLISQVEGEFTDANSPVHILLTMVRDGISAEDHERRLRNRYAMATALYSSGFVPEDPMHIQYFRLPWIGKNEMQKKVRNGYTKIPKIKENPNYTSEPLIVPYEWFEQEKVYLSNNANTGEAAHQKYVLLVWLPESAFSDQPLMRMAQVIDALGHCPNSIDLIGPSRSGTLRTMLSEVGLIDNSKEKDKGDNYVDVRSKLNGLTILSPWSTTSPALLMEKEKWTVNKANKSSLSDMYEVIPAEFMKIDINFVRMIGSDDLLALELINELKRRGVDALNKKHKIALISEWDTFYGNAFPLTFATMIKSIKRDTWPRQPNSWGVYARHLNQREYASSFPVNLHTYSYIRGLDGKLPESQSSKEVKSNENSEDNSNLTHTKGLELPVGRSQLDYVRRLTQKLSDKFENFGNNKLKAIGVVGSDVYDKMVLLQAIREQFSDIIIFTIDLDARMIHHEQLKWTRNVIVASNYGLELSNTFLSGVYGQRESDLSPFRDNYQTSLFLACRTALMPREDSSMLYPNISPEKLTKIISHPRLFEIGRGRAVNLSVSDIEKKESFSIHPPRIRWLGLKVFVTKMSLILVVILLCSLLVVLISPNAKKIVPFMSIRKWGKKGIAIKSLILVMIILVGTVIYDHYREGGEPFSLDAGVSIWPGEILRFIAVILGASLLFRLVNKLRKNGEELAEDFNLPKEPKMERQYTSFWERLKSHYSWNSIEKHFGCILAPDWIPEVKARVDAKKIWNDYLIKGKSGSRFLRSVPMAVAYIVLSAVVIYIFGQPNTPFRGKISFVVNNIILILSGVYIVTLIFFVVDATYLSLGLTGPLIKICTIWPDKAMKKIKDDPDIEEKDFAELLDVRFVTKLTEDIGKMIYWPFIVLAVMAAAHFPYFDNWNFPISLMITYSIPSIYLIICAVRLQRTAKTVRAKALEYLNGRLFATRFGKNYNRKRAVKLTRLIREINSLHEGAFRPFYENPVIHVILGSSGAGLLALLKYMPLS